MLSNLLLLKFDYGLPSVSGGGTDFVLGGLNFLGTSPPVAKKISVSVPLQGYNIQKKGRKNFFFKLISKFFFPEIHFLNKILQICPLIPKFSKNNLNFSLIVKMFSKNSNFLGGLSPPTFTSEKGTKKNFFDLYQKIFSGNTLFKQNIANLSPYT